MRRLLAIFLLGESRKVGFGIWIFMASGLFLICGKITATDWLTCIFLSTGLIGGGTVVDQMLKDKRDANPTPPPAG